MSRIPSRIERIDVKISSFYEKGLFLIYGLISVDMLNYFDIRDRNSSLSSFFILGIFKILNASIIECY